MPDRNHTERANFGKLREVIQPPNLIEIQITSYLDFLQKGVPEKQRKVGRAKPNTFKGGQFIKSVTISSSMSPSVKVASTEFSKY